MSNFVISLLLAAGITGWLYSKLARRSGEGNASRVVIGTAVASIGLFIVIYLTLSVVLKK